MRIGIILLHWRIWRKSYSGETSFRKNELGRFLKTGDNYEPACNATFDVPAGSGTCVFMPRCAEKLQSTDLKQCKKLHARAFMIFVYSCHTVFRPLASTFLSPHEKVKAREGVCRCRRPGWQTGQRKRRTLIQGKLTVLVMHTHFANFETFKMEEKLPTL